MGSIANWLFGQASPPDPVTIAKLELAQLEQLAEIERRKRAILGSMPQPHPPTKKDIK